MKVMFPALVMRVVPLTGDQKSRSLLCHRVWSAEETSGTVSVNPLAEVLWPTGVAEVAEA